MVKYDWTPGMPFLKDYEGGRCLPQVFSALIDGPAPAMPTFTDDTIFAGKKQCLFQVVVLLDELAGVSAAEKELAGIDTCSAGELRAQEATFLIHDFATPRRRSVEAQRQDLNIIRVVTASEYEEVSALHPENAVHRPNPQFYNPNRIRDDVGHDKVFIIVRPDRFIFAACRDRTELEHTASLIAASLQPTKAPSKK